MLGTSGTESFNDRTWYKTFEKNGDIYYLAMNCEDESRSLQITVQADYMKLLIGENVSLENGVLFLEVEPNEVYFLKLADGSEMGIYKGNIQHTTLQSGEFDVRNAGCVALYSISSGTKELVYCGKPDMLQLNLITGRNYELKLFSWDENLNPFISYTAVTQ